MNTRKEVEEWVELMELARKQGMTPEQVRSIIKYVEELNKVLVEELHEIFPK